MDRNLFLAFALSILVLVLWSMAQPPPRRPPPGETVAQATPTPLPETPDTGYPVTSTPAPAASTPMATSSLSPVEPLPGLEPVEGERIAIENALYAAEFTTAGGSLAHWELRDYHEGPARGREPIALTTGEAPLADSLITPFRGLGLGDLTQVPFEVVAHDADQLVFELRRDGVTVRKTYTFQDQSYEFRLRLEVRNDSAGPVATDFAVAWPAHVSEVPDFREQTLVALHEGEVVRHPLNGIGGAGFFGSFTGGAPETSWRYDRDVDWVGVDNTYFLSVVLPDAPAQANAVFFATTPGKAGVAEVSFGAVSIPPGQALVREFRAYLGPKQVARLEALGGEAVRSIDLGWSWVAPLTRAFNWLLGALYTFVPNYGLAIIVLTVLVRLVTVPLTNRQMRSMERMRRLQPKIRELQEKHADDRQKQSEEMMALYKREKVNPLGGCLPMILQLPVFIGLFYALRSSIQLRQAPFFGWIDDLSQPETLLMVPGIELPIRVLPLLMGASMVLQQKITPMQADPAQARMMMTIMPIMMTVLFYQFPSGLVLYWMVSNIVAIGHQLLVGRRMRTSE